MLDGERKQGHKDALMKDDPAWNFGRAVIEVLIVTAMLAVLTAVGVT